MQNSMDSSNRVSQRRKRRRRKVRIRAVIFALVLAVVVYLAAIIVSLHGGLSTTVAQNGTVSEVVTVSGYVFRDQTIINSPGSGHIECIVGEGDRVREGQTIGYVCENVPDAAVMDRIKTLHKAIRRNGLGNTSAYMADAGTSEKQISELSRTLSDARQNCDLSYAEEKKDEINLIISRRTSENASDGSSSVTDETQYLENELKKVLASAGSFVEIKAAAGGVFSSRIDGLEDMLEYDKAMTVTPEYLKALDSMNTTVTQSIEAGQPLCKIINNYTWYFAAAMSERELVNIKEGQSVRMEFYDLSNTPVSGTVSKISDMDSGKCAVIISTNKYVSGIYSSGRVNAEIVTVNAEGIKLPAECLRVKNETAGVYVVRLDKARFAPVEVKYKNDDWVVVSALEPEEGGAKLRIYDEVIVECRNLEDGKVVR